MNRKRSKDGGFFVVLVERGLEEEVDDDDGFDKVRDILNLANRPRNKSTT